MKQQLFDTTSERLIQHAVETYEGPTTIAMALPFNMLGSNLILVTDKGEIVERGTQQELKNIRGLYADYITSNLRINL